MVMGEILTGYYQNPKKGLKCTGPRQAAAIDLASNNTEQKEGKNRGTQRTPCPGFRVYLKAKDLILLNFEIVFLFVECSVAQ